MGEPRKLGPDGQKVLHRIREKSLDPEALAKYHRELEDRSKTFWAEKEAQKAQEARTRRALLLGIPFASHASLTPSEWKGGLIYGPAGVGKTREAIQRLMLITETKCFVEALEFVDLARSIELDRASELEEARWRRVFMSKYLVLDDIGTRRNTDFGVEQLYRLTNARWKDGFPTLATSNFRPSDLAEHFGDYGDRIISRILAFGPSVEMTGPDRRVQRAGLPEGAVGVVR